ncbi:valine-rich protein [Ooceraea biroi]|uniref:valine-rich protein n=1 Tax=Ooceraea biroi TaxID=2015173 RepID=UPI000F088F59|nr:valine-rich protein [Ooceraea biroi]
MLLGVVTCSYSSEWGFGGHGDGELTLGEISIDHGLGGLELGGTGGHSLEFLGNSLLNKVSGWHSSYGDIGGSHGHLIPVVKHIGIPTIKKVPISVPHPVVETVPQPYPVAVVVPKPVPYAVEKPIIKTVEKKIPTPVEKIIPIKIEKPVPFHVVKHVPVPVEKPIPIKVPIYKTIVHKVKGHKSH